jgi:glycosyltransferase involved in cell wall biosynthesis
LKVIYLHQYFNTPEDGGSLRSYHLAKALIANNIEVEIITAHNQKKYLFKDIEGVKVHYLPIYYDNALGFLGRVWAFIKFMYLAYRQAVKIAGADIVYATSTPLTVGLPALWLKKKKKIPYIFEVRDLWPEAPIQLGFIRNYFLKKYLRRLELTIYKNAKKIVALSPGIYADIQAIVPHQEIYLIPNMADCEGFEYQESPSKIHSNRFIVSYCGTVGLANHLEYLINIATYFQSKGLDSVEFWIIGKGGRLQFIQRLASEKGLQNVRFFPFGSTSEVRNILSQSDAVYISFWNKPILETNSPNKFFDALAAGKLITLNTKGWLKDLIEENSCGFYAHPENPEEFYLKLKPFLTDPSLCRIFQKNARLLAETHFSKTKMQAKFLTLFESQSDLKY